MWGASKDRRLDWHRNKSVSFCNICSIKVYVKPKWEDLLSFRIRGNVAVEPLSSKAAQSLRPGSDQDSTGPRALPRTRQQLPVDGPALRKEYNRRLNAIHISSPRAVPIPPEEPRLVPEGLGPARMIEAAFSANAYAGSMGYNTQNQEMGRSTMSNDAHAQRTRQGISRSPRLPRSL